MQKDDVIDIVRALNASGVRYLIAGGLAVVAHGYVRLTADVDIILDLSSPLLGDSLMALSKLGYRPRAPVPIGQFAVEAKRAEWIKEKGLKVFSLNSSRRRATEIDLFVESPIQFDAAYTRATRLMMAPGVEAVFLGFDDLLQLKRAAGRRKDLDDIEQLRKLRRDADG